MEEVIIEDDVWTLLARGENERVRAYFQGEVGVNDTSPQRSTPLHMAVGTQNLEMISYFLSMGANVNILDGLGRTPLDISAELLDPSTAEILLKAGSNIHHSPGDNISAAEIGVIESGNFLQAILTPASLESTNSSGKTILHMAAEAGNAPAVNIILKAGKNSISKKDSQGNTALDIVLEHTGSLNHAEAAEYLILAGAVSSHPLYSYFAPAVRSSNYNLRSSDGMAPLHHMARNGYGGYLAFVLEHDNVNINTKNASGETPLHEAVRSGNIQIIQALLDHGADVNAQDARGNSVLHIAVPPASQIQVLNLLLSAGANPNAKDEHGDSPLHIAIILNRNTEIIERLLYAGADVTIRNIDGETPLYAAVTYQRANLIPLLIEYKSDIFAADNSGVTPYEKALAYGGSLLYSLISNETVQQNDNQGNTMLHYTVRLQGNTDVIRYILDSNASVNARNKEGDTSLHIAVRLNRQEAGEILLSRGADIFATNAKGESPLYITFPRPGSVSELRRWMITPQTLTARDSLGNTALHYLAQWQFNDGISLLVQQGAAVNAVNARGEPPLFAAVQVNAPATIRTLFSNGANIDARDNLGNTALHAAIRWNAVSAAKNLLDLGLDINAYALNGKTALHDAVRSGMTEMENLLLSREYNADLEVRDIDGNTPFVEAVLGGYLSSMEQLVLHGADPNTRNFRGDTALHLAVAMDRSDIATLLLDWGTSIHARNSAERTPFQEALRDSPGMVRTLLTKDRLYSSDDNGSSPLHIAIQERCPISTIRAILTLGARTSALDYEGRTPLRIAVDRRNWEAAKLLADAGADVFLTARDGQGPADIVLALGAEPIDALFSGKAINSRDASGNTILHYAAKIGNTAVIMQLIELGANKGTKNISDESPADIAQRWKHSGAVSLLN